ncbi:uncharacterized protein [Medicago truncatula]|uniref:uncharacterized protein n=1 Tax=Medicago truncatula TaxID=3880 RepID=UPI0019685643|nr:uncharacterized protein LOC120579641 [Medicago truncatula]
MINLIHKRDEVNDANSDENYQETELFEDTLVINGPFTEIGLENLDLNNTEIVEDSEPVEDMITGTVCEYETEVVFDSEDEEMNNTGKVTVGKRFLEDESSPTVYNSSVLFKKRLPKLPCEQANSKSNGTTCGKSITGESFDDNNHQYLPAMSYDAHSPTVAALGFVDQYLSQIDVDLFQGFQNGKIAMEKSPQVSSARGSISLAKKFKARTQSEDKDPLKWADSDQNLKEAGIFCKKLEASFSFGSHGLTYNRRRQQKGSRLQNQGKCSASNGCDENQGNYSASNQCDENLVQEPTMATDNNNSLKELYVESCAARGDVDIYTSVAHTEDMLILA